MSTDSNTADTTERRADTTTRRARRRGRKRGEAVASLVSDGANSVAAGATQRIEEEVARRKDEGTDRLSRIADAIEDAGEALERELPPVADLVYRASDEVDVFAEAVRERDARELAGLAHSFVRRRPVAFASLTALAGFAAVRFLTAEIRADDGEESDRPGSAGEISAGGRSASERSDGERERDRLPRTALKGLEGEESSSGDPGGIAPGAPGFEAHDNAEKDRTEKNRTDKS